MEWTDQVISGLEKVFGRHPFSVIFTNLFAFAFGSLILWLCIAVTNDQLEWKLNILLATIGALVGWALGMFFAPYDTGEQERFSSIGQSISVFASGYLVSKVDRFLEATLFVNNIPYHPAWVRALLFFKLPNVVDAPGIYEQSLFQKRSQNFVSHKETIYITSHFQNRVLPGRTTLTRRVKKDMDDAFKGIGRPLTGKGLEEAFNTLAVGQPELWAVLSVETAGSGYLPDRRPRILFERHIFRRQTHWRFDDARPDLSNSKPGGYLLESHEYRRLEAALQLDRNAALSATSWGLGQVMGFNAILAGFTNTEAMVKAMVDSENAQLMGMATWIDRSGIAGSLRAHRWAEFAKAYNGPGYRKNQYDTRLAAHYQKFNLGPLPDLMVRTIQSYLVNLGYNPGIIDGILGRLTRSAIQEYQIEKGLDATGEPSLALAQHLEEELTIASDDQHKGKR